MYKIYHSENKIKSKRIFKSIPYKVKGVLGSWEQCWFMHAGQAGSSEG